MAQSEKPETLVAEPVDEAVARSQPVMARRRLVQAVAGIGAAGMLSVAGAKALAAAEDDSPTPADGGLPADAAEGALVAHVVDSTSGHLDLFVGSRVVSVRDRDLAARLTRAAR